jgi:hypothetical protein
MKVIFKKSARHWWLRPVILTTLEAEIGRIIFQASSGKKSFQDLNKIKSWAWWLTPVIPAAVKK